MSKPWGGVGAWALDAERAEAEERELAAAAAAAPPELFPSLKEAAASKPQKKKKKGTALSLSQFTTGTHVGPGTGTGSGSKFLTHNEILRLPTGPKDRSPEELENTRGFRSYGSGGGGGGPRRSYGGGFDGDNRRGPTPSRESELDMPSRADEVDNWAAGKKSSSFTPMDNSRYGSVASEGPSKADEADNWFSNRKPASTLPAPSRYSGFGSGFRDSGASSDSDRWAARGGDRDLRERPRLVLDKPKGEVGGTVGEPVKTRASPFGAARPREEVLAEKGLDWRKMDTEIEVKKTSRPNSSHSSRPSSAHSSRPGSSGGEGAVKARPKVNPFGDARPREVLLEEKGREWRKIDLEAEHRLVDRPETEEEKLLKEEINHLKKAQTKAPEENLNTNPEQISAEQLTNLHDQISEREKDLDKLARELDDKIRFGQKATSSGVNRISFSSDRLLPQPGMFEDAKSRDAIDRPRSRGGNGDSWGRPLDDKRGFQGGRETSFHGSKDIDRSRREGW